MVAVCDWQENTQPYIKTPENKKQSGADKKKVKNAVFYKM